MVVRDAAWEAAKHMFADRHFVVLPRFVEDSLLDRLARQVAEGEFRKFEHPIGATEATMDGAAACPRVFRLLLNRPAVFVAMQELLDVGHESFQARQDVGDGRIRSFRVGRCFKMVPGRHRSIWHTDAGDGQLIGLSINLVEGAAGGGIEFGRAEAETSSTTLCVKIMPAFGDAVLFRIAKGLVHRGTVPRCAFTGWFTSRPEYMPLIFRDPDQMRRP